MVLSSLARLPNGHPGMSPSSSVNRPTSSAMPTVSCLELRHRGLARRQGRHHDGLYASLQCRSMTATASSCLEEKKW